MYNYKRAKYNMRSKKRNRNHSSKKHQHPSPMRGGIDPFDPRYAHVPLDVPITHVEDYVKRKNNRNDQDHLQSQIMYFKKEFGCLPIIKASANHTNTHNTATTTSTASVSTSTQIESTMHQTNTNTATHTQTNDDHKDDNNDEDDDDDEHYQPPHTSNTFIQTNDIILPSYDSINTFRNALARYEAWQFNNNYNNHRNTDDVHAIPIQTQPLHSNTNNNGQYQYVAPFYNPFLRINIMNRYQTSQNDDDDTKDGLHEEHQTIVEDQNTTHYGFAEHDTVFPLSHYEQNRTNTNDVNTVTEEEAMTRNDAYQRYRQYYRFRHSFRALQYHNIRRRLWTQNRMSDDTNNTSNRSDDNHNTHHHNAPYWVMPQFGFDDNDTVTYRHMNAHNNGHNWSRISNILTFNTLSDDDHDPINNNNNSNSHTHSSNNTIKLKVISPKLKHNAAASRLDGLQDFKAATVLIPLRLTSVAPFKQRIYTTYDVKRSQKEEMDEDEMVHSSDEDWDCTMAMNDDEDYDMDSHNKDDTIVISGIDRTQNLLSQLSSDLHLIILNMLTGLGNARTMALYKSLRSELTEFDIERVRNCSVYKCQALFVERYRQNLFDEKYKALHQPALTRALSCEPRNLSEFQRDRKARVLRKQYSNPNRMDDDEKAPAI
eukprot:64333_1